jgi:septal ring factor EnvC (AmiA/AmiB activator)
MLQGRGDELEALRTELTMVRDQASRDVTHMRAEVERLRHALAGAQQVDSTSVLAQEAQRQDLAGLRRALGERQRELREADEARHTLEDSLEDAHREIDNLRRELTRMRGGNGALSGGEPAGAKPTGSEPPPGGESEPTKPGSRLRNIFRGGLPG